MIRVLKIMLLFTGISCFCFFLQPAFAKSRVLTNVKVIHASTEANHVDPGLDKIISELRSVFKYTSYRLLNNHRLNLGFNEMGQVALPGKRTLIVIPSNMDGKRISYLIKIQKNKQPIFQTRVLLKKNSSITIGGPKYNKGVLLFNISGSLQ